MRSFLLLLLPSLLHSATLRTLSPSSNETEDDPDKPERYRTDVPYMLCPVGSLIDWRPRRVASLTHVTVSDKRTFDHPKAFDYPFATVEYGRSCVLTLGFTARESRPILAYVGTQIPGLIETTMTGYYRLTREPRRNPIKGQLPDMAVFYSNQRKRFGNCDLYKNAQHIRYKSDTGFYFVVCYGNFTQLVGEKTKANITAAGDEVIADFRNLTNFKSVGKGLKWNSKKQNLYFLEPAHFKRRLKHVMDQLYDKPVYWVNPTEFEGWSETVMPHYDLRTVIYESRYKKVRTEADNRMTLRFLIATFLNILQCILMEKFYLLLRKYLL